MRTIEELVYSIGKKEVEPIKEDLKHLYERELFEKQIYTNQARLLVGDIIGVVNHLAEEEEKHSFLIRTPLSNAGISSPSFLSDVPSPTNSSSISDWLKYDIEQEKITTDAYSLASEKAPSKTKKVLEHIMSEELVHINILQDHLKGYE